MKNNLKCPKPIKITIGPSDGCAITPWSISKCSDQVNSPNNKPLKELISCVKTLYNLLNIVSCVPRSLEDIDDK